MDIDILSGLQELISLLQQWLGDHAANIFYILLGAWVVRRFGVSLMGTLLARAVPAHAYATKADRDKRVRTLRRLLSAGIRFVVYLIAALLVVGELNPSYMAALFASAGLVTVALGFGAQSLVKDLVSGIFIISENQYRVGDMVTIADVSGTVEDVTIRTTVLRDLDGNVHHVPNGLIEVTTNKTIGYSQLNETIIVDTKTNLETLEQVINKAGQEIGELEVFKSKILEPIRMSTVRGYAQNGLSIVIAGKVVAGEKVAIKSELYKRLHKAFLKHKIHVSFTPITPATGTPVKK